MKLEKLNFSGGIAPRHPITDEFTVMSHHRQVYQHVNKRETDTKMEERLIVAVCGHPVLYDSAAVFYRDRTKKEEAWAKVSEEVGLSGKL